MWTQDVASSTRSFPPKRGMYTWETICSQLDEPVWQVRGQLIQKDGYEIYVEENGFEVAMRDPETMENRPIFKVRNLDIEEPSYAAAIIYILDNIESVVQSGIEQQVTPVDQQ